MRAAYEWYGQKVPDKLIPPPLHDVEEMYWEAFWSLSTDRSYAMGASGPIPWSSIKAYSEQIKWSDMDTLNRVIRALDDVYLSHESEKSKTPSAK